MTEQTQVCPAGRELDLSIGLPPDLGQWIHIDDESHCHADARCFPDGKCGLKRRTGFYEHWKHGVPTGWYHLWDTEGAGNNRCHGHACPEKLLAEDVPERRTNAAIAFRYDDESGVSEYEYDGKWRFDQRVRGDGPPKPQQRVPGKGERRQHQLQFCPACQDFQYELSVEGAAGICEVCYGPMGDPDNDRRIATEPRRQALHHDVKHESLPEFVGTEQPTTDYQVKVGQQDLLRRLRSEVRGAGAFFRMGFNAEASDLLAADRELEHEAADTIEALTKRAEAAEELVREMATEMLKAQQLVQYHGRQLNEEGVDHILEAVITKVHEAGILEEEK